MGVYTFASKPTTPGERTPDLLIRFQAVSRTQPCVHYRFMSVHSRTKLIQVRRYITKYFKTVYETGFVFLCKTKQILKSDENKLTVFDILPKIPEISSGKTPAECFQYPDVQYKKVWYNYDGKRYHCMCACVIFLFERSKVSHWPQEVLREELAASAIDGFSHIPTDIMSWSGKLVECRGTPLHIYAALGKKDELATAIHQLQDGTTAKALKDQRGATPLHYAAANGKLDECEILVAGVGSEMIYHTDNWKRSPLHHALYRRKASTITYLIQMNADVDTPDDNGNSCIDLLYKQKAKDVEFIVSKLETDCVDDRVRCCLMYLSMANKMFSNVRRIADSLKPSSELKLGTTFLHLSAKYKLTDVTKTLLDRGFERSERDLMEFLPFHIACKIGAIDQVSLLLFPNISDADLNKGIQLSIRYGNIEVCREIHSFRADIELEETTVCMVMRTAQSMLRKFKLKTVDEEPLKHFETVASMLLPIIKSLSDVLNTYVFDCALYGAAETLIMLKSLGADFNTCDYSGRSPLHESSQSNKLRCTQVLLKGGADPNVTDWRGSTPLHYACEKGNNNIVKCLMENTNVKANIKDVNGRTPLLVAVYHRRDETVSYLLKYCDKVVDLTCSDKFGYGLLHYGLLMKEETLDLIVEKLSGKPKPLHDEEGSKAKKRIRDSSWIPKIINTSYKAVSIHGNDEESSRQSFSLTKNIKMTLWKTREEELRWSRSIQKLPEIEYEQCSGCRHFIKPTTKHKCATPKDKRNKKTKLKAFKFHEKSGDKVKTTSSAFFLAVKTGSTMAMKKIKKFDLTASSFRDDFGRNALELAIEMRSLRLVKAVMELCSDIDKSNAIQRVVSLPKGSKKESTQLQLLVYLFSVDFKAQGDLALTTAIKEKNFDIIDELVKNIDAISDETMVLAASSGVLDIVEPVFRKWRKNKSRRLNAIDIIGVACSSKTLSVEVVNYLISRQKPKDNSVVKSSVESSKYAEELSKSLTIPVVRRKSLLGKLLYKKHPARRAKPPVSSEVFNDIGHILLKNDPEMGLDTTGQVHIACECLHDCIEMKCYQLAEAIIKKSAGVVWSCELSDRRCSFQRNFQKKLYNFRSTQLVDVSYLQSLVLVASHKDVPDSILHLILKNGDIFFHSEEGSDTVVDVEIFPKEGSFENAEKLKDNMIRLTMTVLELLTGEKYPKQNLLKVWRHVPGVLQHVNLLTRDVNFEEFIKTKDDQFLRHCYRLFRDVAFTNKYPGTNVLHVASGWQDSGALKMVLKATVPIDVMAENDGGVNALDVAVTFGYWQHYKLLMDNGGSVTDLALESCCLKDTELVKSIMMISNKLMAMGWSDWLLKWTGAKPYKRLLGKTPDELHPKARLKIVKDIWSRLEVEPDGKILKDDADLINGCCLFKLWEVLEFFLDKGSHLVINSLNQEKGLHSQTPETISMLCQYCPTSVVKKFLELIDKNIKKLGNKALGEIILYLACRNENEICNHLVSKSLTSIEIKSYEDLLTAVDITGKSALHHLANNGNHEVLKFLVSNLNPCCIHESPVLDLRDKSGSTALWYALTKQNWHCAELLLMCGCNPTLLKGVPDFDTKRRFTYQKPIGLDQLFPVENEIQQNHGKQICRSWVPWRSGYYFSLSSRSSHRGLKEEYKEDKGRAAMKIVKTLKSNGHRRVQELIKLSKVAKNNRAALIHVAFAIGDQQLVSKTLDIQPTIVNLKDSNKVLPMTYGVVYGNPSIERNMPLTKDASQIQPLVWKFMSVRNRYERLTYSLTQLLFFIGWRHIGEGAKLPYPFHFFGIKAETSGCNDGDLGILLKRIHAENWKLNSTETVAKYKSTVRDTLTTFYTESSVNIFMNILEYLQVGELNEQYNKYYLLCSEDQNTNGNIVDVLKREIESIGVDEMTNTIWAVLLMSGESWVFDLYLDKIKKSETRKLSDPVLLNLTLFDLLPLYARSSDKTDILRLRKKTVENVKQLLLSEEGLTLSTDMVTIAVYKQLWAYLQLIGQHTLLESGVLNSVWQTVMARAAETGNFNFIKSILSSLEITKMTNEQKACFTAFICISGLNGHFEIVKYLVRSRIPMVCDMNDPAFQNLLGKHYVPSWGVLEYALKGNCAKTFEFLLQCYKEDKSIRNTVQVNILTELASQIGNVEIFKLLSKYSDKELGLVMPRDVLDKAYRFSLAKGREKFCLQLLENSNTSLVVYSESRESSLHFAAIHGMYTLASKLLQTRPEILNQTDRHGNMALDYANACGNVIVARLLEEHKAEFSTNYTQTSYCCGWFHNYMIENEKKETVEDDSPKFFKNLKRMKMDLLSVLRTGNDHLGEYIISNSKYLIKEQLKSNFSETVSLYMYAAETGCNSSLNLLLQVINNDDNLVKKVMSHEGKNQETVLTCAVLNNHLECIRLIMNFDISWLQKDNRENALHVAVRRSHLDVVTLVDKKSKGTLRTQNDQYGVTPIIYAAALGNHHIVAYLSSEPSLISTTHVNHKTEDQTDYYCMECLLDLCIGWSKLYQNQQYFAMQERTTRPLDEEGKFCRLFFRRQKAVVNYWSYQHKLKYETTSEHLLQRMMREIPKGCTAWQQVLTCMGYKESEDNLHELLLLLPSHGKEPLATKMKKVMTKKEYTKTLIRLVESGLSVEDFLLSAAACGNTEFLENFDSKNIVDGEDRASLNEIAFAFGKTSTALYLQQNSNTIYEVFQDLSDVLPLRVKWLTRMEKLGNETWLKSISEDPLVGKLSMADFWIIANFPDNIIEKICEDIEPNSLIPQILAEKRYNVDIESFKRNNPSCSNEINHRVYIASSLIYGRQLIMFAKNGNEKFKTTQTIKLVCEPSGPGNLPKIHIDSGNYQESVVFTQSNSGTSLMIDNSLVQKTEEMRVRNYIMTNIVSEVTSMVEDVFRRDVKLRIDWQSLESRRRSGNYDLVLKLLSGNSNRNLLGGLHDVLNQCLYIRQDLYDMYDETTVNLALQPLSHIQEVVVTYVDTLQGADTTRKPTSTSLSDMLTWEFTYDKNTLKYNRENFPLLTALVRYHQLGGAVYSSISRILNLNTNITEEKKGDKDKPQDRITLDIDIKSFGVKNGTMIHEKLCQGISREVDAIASECEAMLRLSINSKRALLRNSPSVQGTGITIHDSSVTVSVCLSMNSQKILTVERGQIRQKLEEIEDQQMFSSWDPEKLDPVKHEIDDITQYLKSEFGFCTQIIFDEKRLMLSVFQKYRREMTHPHTLMLNLMLKCCRQLLDSLKETILQIFDGLPVDYVMYLNKDKSVLIGMWTKVPSVNVTTYDQASTYMALIAKKVKLMYKGRFWWSIDFEWQRREEYSCNLIDITKAEHCWQHSDFKTTPIFPTNERKREFGLISLSNNLYRITDSKMFGEVLSKFPGKVNITPDIYFEVESMSSFSLRDKLSAELDRTLKNTNQFNKTNIIAQVEIMLFSCFNELKISRPNISIDFESFERTYKSDKCNAPDIAQNIILVAYHFENALLEIKSKFKGNALNTARFRDREPRREIGMPCMRFSDIMNGFKGILQNIKSIVIRKNEEDQQNSSGKMKRSKASNPSIHFTEEGVIVLLSNATVDRSLKNSMETLLTNVFVSSLSKEVVNHVSVETGIAARYLQVNYKYSESLLFKESALWHAYLHQKGSLNLSSFHALKVDKQGVMFEMKSKSNLDIYVSFNENYHEDTRSLRNIGKVSLDSAVFDVFEGDTCFLRFGENNLRIKLPLNLNEKVDKHLFSFEIEYEQSSNGNGSERLRINTTRLQTVNTDVCCLYFDIPSNLDASRDQVNGSMFFNQRCNFSVFFKERAIKTYKEINISKRAFTKHATLPSTALKIKKGGWIKIGIQHGCTKDSEREEICKYRHMRGNYITDVFSSNLVHYTSTYVQSFIMYRHQNNYITQDSPVTITNDTLYVRNESTEVKVKAICKICGEHLYICTPFPELMPTTELIINKVDNEEDDNDTV